MHCPTCGASLEDVNRFSHLVVCPHCESAVILDEKVARVSGKMAVLPQTASPLFVGATGRLLDRHFSLLGRVRYGYSKGYWDEWYVVFEDDSTAWISEDEENYTLESCSEGEEVSFEYASTAPGDHVQLGETLFHVDEKDVAVCEGAEGQIPFPVVQGKKTPYLDLSTDDAFATVEWELDGRLRVFRGRRMDVAELELDATAEEVGAVAGAGIVAERAATEATRERITRAEDRVKGITCYSCGGSLEIPDAGAESITCSFCGSVVDLSLTPIQCANCSATVPVHGGARAKSLVCSHCGAQLDISRGQPSVIGSLVDVRRPRVPLKLGQQCTLRGDRYEVVGHIRYRVTEEGEVFTYDEFMLHSKTAGYKWLLLTRGHFSFSHELDERPRGVFPKTARRRQKFQFAGKTWTVFERGQNAEIAFVDGELPWVAKVGDRNGYMDAICPPHLLSAEWTESEMEWYLSEYMPRRQVAKAFGTAEDKLPRPGGVASNQPYPAGPFRRQSAWVMALFAVLNLLAAWWMLSPGRQLKQFVIQPAEYAGEFRSPTFAVNKPNTCCRARFEVQGSTHGVHLDVTVLSAGGGRPGASSTVTSGGRAVASAGVWSKSTRDDGFKFRLKKRGDYQLLVRKSAGAPTNSRLNVSPVRVTVYEGTKSARYHFLLGILGLMWAVVEWGRRIAFEGMRWSG